MNERILIVEDNEINMKLIKAILGKRGYLLVEAKDGEEALQAVVREKPDLILMDIQIPKVDGLEVTRRIRGMEEISQTVIIALTAHAMEGDKEKILDAGCDGYIAKPIDTRTFPLEVEAILARKCHAA
ncbi:MAG TPA: response regulator [Thermodesulfobacteriota bacterium]|nr:response regulator [Thermodesulfobacteriota bacterium]